MGFCKISFGIFMGFEVIDYCFILVVYIIPLITNTIIVNFTNIATFHSHLYFFIQLIEKLRQVTKNEQYMLPFPNYLNTLIIINKLLFMM